MSEELEFIDRTLAAIFAKHAGRDARAADAVGFPHRLWSVLEEAGMTSVGDVDNEAGTAPLAVIARAVGRVGGSGPPRRDGRPRLLGPQRRGHPCAAGDHDLRVTHRDDVLELSDDVSGGASVVSLHRVPWGRDAAHVPPYPPRWQPVCRAGPVDLADPSPPARNLADEPRDTLLWFATVRRGPGRRPRPADPGGPRRRGAVLRAASMAGAMDTVGTCRRVRRQRHQFGQRIDRSRRCSTIW